MANRGQIKPGEVRNPNGRPPKSRALTDALRLRGRKTVEDIDGKNHAGNAVVARALWELATTGRTRLPGQDEKDEYAIGVKGWFEIVKFIYGQIDGPPPKPVEISGPDGGAITLKWQDIDTDGN